MSWRAAKSLIVLRDQVNKAYPNRSKASDGLIGDAAHAASASDHNPNRNGVVCALDLTHDPANGFDAHALAEHLRVNRHPNLRYVISNARIAGAHTGWQWRPSVGHYQHCHISVGTHGVGDGQTYDNYDSTQAWDIGIKKGDDMVEDNQRHFDLYAQTWANATGRKLTRNEFRISFVGRDKAEVQTVIHQSAETAAYARLAADGKKLPSVQGELAKSKAETAQVKAQLAEKDKQIAAQSKEISKLLAQVALQSEDTKNLNALGQALQWFVSRVGLK